MGILAVFGFLGIIFLVTLGGSVYALFQAWPRGEGLLFSKVRIILYWLLASALVAAFTAYLWNSLANSDYGE